MQSLLPQAPVIRPVMAEAPGVIAAIDTRRIGLAVVGLGGGRTRSDGVIDPRVGFTALAGLGTSTDTVPLAFVHAADAASADQATVELRAAYTVAASAPAAREPVLERMTESTDA